MGRVGKAEIKMVMVVSYYIIMGVTSLIAFTYSEVEAGTLRTSLEELIICESTGNLECEVDSGTLIIFRGISTASIVMFAFLPVVVILFSFDFNICRKISS